MCILSVEKYKDKTVKFLLDGRQRRNALKQLAEDPENLYLWAKKFLDLKASVPKADWTALLDEIFDNSTVMAKILPLI